MKGRCRLFGLLFFLLLATTAFGSAYEKGQKVEVEWNGTWYPAVVLAVGEGQWQIHYDGYGDNWDEWVGPARIRAAGVKAAQKITAGGPRSGSGSGRAVKADDDLAQEITIRRGGTIWATVAPNGTIRLNGSIVGEFSGGGTVRKSGAIVGEVEGNGTIRKSGMIVGEIETGGTFRRNGSIIGEVEDGGTIRENGAVWGSAEPCCGNHLAKRKVAAVLVFFSDDFGF